MFRVLLSGTISTAVVAAVAVGAQQSGDDFRWAGQVARGKTIEIKGVNGGIAAETAAGNQVEILAHKRARRSDTIEVSLQVVEHDGNVTICAVYPTPARSSNLRSSRPRRDTGPNECQPGDGGRMSVNNNDVNVEFTVRVPEGVRLAARTVNGEITATSLKSDMDVATVNGRVRLSTTGTASAETVNGSIDVSLGAAKWNEALDFHTVNGSITLDLPRGASADVRAETMNGHVTSDFPMTITSSRHGGRRITGSIGSGGNGLFLSTTNGGIHLRSAP
jgi:DUF4097 and DUF4098 domain-containing protein YvlB